MNKVSSSKIKDILTNRLGLDTRVTILGHTQRGGAACAYDRWLSTLQGVEAVRAVLEMSPESPSPVITIRENKIMRTPLMEAVQATKDVTARIDNKEFEKAMEMRDAEFKEYYHAYRNTASPEHPKMILPEGKVGLKSQPTGASQDCQILTTHSECASPSFTSVRPQVV